MIEKNTAKATEAHQTAEEARALLDEKELEAKKIQDEINESKITIQ